MAQRRSKEGSSRRVESSPPKPKGGKSSARKKISKGQAAKISKTTSRAVSTSDRNLAYTDEIHRRLKKKFGPAKCPLTYQKPHELAIAVILSAQCTDERVNLTTPALFKKYPEPRDYYEASLSELQHMIFSTGFYKNKARSIQGFCRKLVEEYDGKIPRDALKIQTMPGVGRKTANVIAQELYRESSGVVVDTHVARLSHLLGLSDEKDPGKIEKALMPQIRKKYWIDWSLYMIFLGRFCCKARKRQCDVCPLLDLCPSSDASVPT